MSYAGRKKSVPIEPKPKKGIIKCLRCEKFLKCVNHENDKKKRITMMLTNIKNELSKLRMLVKLIEKGQSTIYMLLVGIIVVLGIVLVV